ncbi:MAG: energy transducer TonB [Deltaproteobacteria bacterium]|nr:energy transducer TonB [Deltaproteobacteria bacterium]
MSMSWAEATAPITDNTLRLELFGAIAEREVTQQETVAPVDAPEPEPEPELVPEPVPEPEPVKEEIAVPKEVPPPPKLRPPKPRPKPPVQRDQSAGQTGRRAASLAKAEKEAQEKAYLSAVGRAVNAHLFYPREAIRQSLTGNTKVRFTVNKNGQIPSSSIRVTVSSGSEILDRSAIETVSRASLGPPPSSMVGQEISVTLVYNKEGNRRRRTSLGS